ncbi:hypothetical protein PF005_g3724 [Phytophthora fragariae]|uniref:Uncharacterized protein n=1 Tax=Phytophthora fragariae TaxID=53985 RepID=A0A6A4ENV1_9STRA|nr:hypothetical protein PF009_g3221 [Phytophthora fragariae]KAE9132603.1 hypothetical protein PF007_g3658 [Phytophthora fragariae]KAE9229792.1 hypothetical protein PF005_g3724 [Phytophthora fragariae]KAE9252656.1 hypothetical protein PF002_g3726 [Phytophthora fragariae]KAE9325205.1 hypothetical protein PF001_g3056 [Phytophthora fragariae]
MKDLGNSTGTTSPHGELYLVVLGGPGPKKTKAAKRFKRSNDIIGECTSSSLCRRGVKRRLESAQTKTQTALVWQYFASVMSQSVGVVIKTDQVSQTYLKLQCIYRQEKKRGRVGISGEVLLDSHSDAEDIDGSEAEQSAGGASADEPTATVARSKATPIEYLASSMHAGMEAIAAFLTGSALSDNKIGSLLATLQCQHKETRLFQALKLQLLQ